jgi:DNA repair exonuclease SbcCD ATPase subunit
MDKHVKDLESQIMIEKKIMAGAESMIREYSNQKKVDKKTLANAEATLSQSKDKIDELNDELTRFKSSGETCDSPITRPLKREMSVSGLLFSSLVILVSQ